MTAAFLSADIVMTDKGFTATTVDLTPLTDEGRKFLNVDPAVASCTYVKTAGIATIGRAERSGLVVDIVKG
jgi:hypothetical protein